MSVNSFFVKSILKWFSRAKRDLPWRSTHDPYRIWVSEVMLQQTQVDRVKDFYYERFLRKFPTVWDLAGASWEDVMEVWRGLGYYRRGRNMQKAAQVLVEQYDGEFPREVSELEKLPGIGKYTARAVASFAFGLDVPVKDTNVSRVLQRYFDISDDEVWDRMESLVPKGESLNFNQGVMELGALVCGAAVPKCSDCPLRSECHFFQSGKNVLLVREKKSLYRAKSYLSLKSKSLATRVAIGLIYRNGKILIVRESREGREKAYRKSYFGFPGGKLENRETDRSALKREVQEELGIEISVRPAFVKTEFEYEKGKPLLLSFHRCQILLGEPRPLEGQEMQWVDVGDLSKYEFWPANREVLEMILGMRW